MKTSESVSNVLPALAKARAQVGRGITKNAKGHGYRYANLSSLLDALAEPFDANELLDVCSQTAYNQVVCRVYHAPSGEWVEVSSAVDASAEEAKRGGTQGAQAAGSAYTYGRRYCLMALLGMAAEDDDGSAASQRRKKPPGQHVTNAVEKLLAAGIKLAAAEKFATDQGLPGVEDWPDESIQMFIRDVGTGKVVL